MLGFFLGDKEIFYSNQTIDFQFAVVSEKQCTCASNLLLDLSASPSASGPLLPVSQCSLSSTGALIGSSGSGSVAVYNTNYSILYSGSKEAPTTCRALAHELYIPRNGIDSLMLQKTTGSPVLLVKCSYSDRRFALKLYYELSQK